MVSGTKNSFSSPTYVSVRLLILTRSACAFSILARSACAFSGDLRLLQRSGVEGAGTRLPNTHALAVEDVCIESPLLDEDCGLWGCCPCEEKFHFFSFWRFCHLHFRN